MKPEFSKPFNLEHAKAGAPFCGGHGEAVRILIWDRKNPKYPIIAIEEDGDQEAVAFRADGKATHGCGAIVQELVMLPLGVIDGKPVFVGDEVEYETFVGWGRDSVSAEWREFGKCRWPAPAKAYPTHTGDLDALRNEYNSILGSTVNGALERVANAALRHAIDAGQVVAKDDHEAALHRLGDQLKRVALGDRAVRDMAIAAAVRTAALTAHPVSRDFETSEDRNELWFRIHSLDLSTIIATVK